MVLIAYGKAFAGPETMAEYTDYPIFMSSAVTPNTLIILDNSASMNCPAYWKDAGGADLDCSGPPGVGYMSNQYVHDPTDANNDGIGSYYGLFDRESQYSFAANKFTINAAGDWNGNFLNWLSMRRIDAARKVLMGGKATPRANVDPGDIPNGIEGQSTTNTQFGDYEYIKYYDEATGVAKKLFPACGSGTDCWFGMQGGYIYFDDDADPFSGYDFRTKIDISVTTEYEPGIIHDIQGNIRLGLEYLNDTNGGGINQYMTEPSALNDNFVNALQNATSNPDTNTPLAEALYTAIGWIGQDATTSVTEGPRYYANNADSYQLGGNTDPFYFADYTQTVRCAKFFIILISGGAPTQDGDLPDALAQPSCLNPANTIKDCYDGAANEYLNDVAYYGHMTDLRPAASASPLDGTQSIQLYTILAFGTNAAAKTVLQEAAKTGGFDDKNGNKIPDNDPDVNGHVFGDVSTTGDSEYDIYDNATGNGGGDGLPDNYFEAKDGDKLKDALARVFTDILKKASSGTAISVLATSASGAGNIYQAYFLPSKTIVGTPTHDVTWTGHMLSLNIDANGHLRDGSNECIRFRFDEGTNQTVIDEVGETGGICDDSTVTATTNLTDFTNYVWDAGDTLQIRDIDADPRSLFTYDPGLNTEVKFVAANAASLATYLDTDDGTTAHLTDPDVGDTDTLDESLINFINGKDYDTWRSREDVNGSTFKLGDIVHSTPSVVSLPAENYGLLYQDASYTEFFNKVRNLGRNTIVYVGANDGILHAFDADSATGRELWGYIPFNLLPHLKWLADPSYTHVNYVDLKTKISDVQMFTCDGNYHVGSNGSKCWGTVLIGGIRMGGGEITDAGATSRISAYYALDITNPNAPEVLWEFTDPGLGFTNSYPAVVKVGTKWYAVFGSGSKSARVPDYEGNPTDLDATLYVVDMETGVLERTFQVPDATSFFADPVAVDIDFLTAPFSTDAVYVGETYWDNTGGGSWNSRMWRLVTFAKEDPGQWKMYNFYNTEKGQAIVSAPSLATDQIKQQWLYFGTGKYYSDVDKVDTEVQTMYGMREPCWNSSTGGWKSPIGPVVNGTCSQEGSQIPGAGTPSVSNANLVNTSGVIVKEGGNFDPVGVLAGTVQANTFDALSNELVYDSVGDPNLWGWYVNLPESGERSLNKPTVIAGLVLFTTFVPNDDICGFSGNSYLNALFYTTGTAYKESVIGCAGGDDLCAGADPTILARTEDAATGMASSIAVHMGREEGAQAYIQLSTGEARALGFSTALETKSGIISWRDL